MVVEVRLRRQLSLGQAKAEPGRTDSAGEPGRIGRQSNVEDGLDSRPAPREGHADVLLPLEDSLLQASQPIGQDSLRETALKSPLPHALPQRLRVMRVTPSEHARFSAREPQAGKWQRNGELTGWR